MFGLGKKRSKLGKFLDRHSITLGVTCNEKDFVPSLWA